MNSLIYNHILRIDSEKNTRFRKLKCGMLIECFEVVSIPLNCLVTRPKSWSFGFFFIPPQFRLPVPQGRKPTRVPARPCGSPHEHSPGRRRSCPDGPAHGRRLRARAVDPRRGCRMQAAWRGWPAARKDRQSRGPSAFSNLANTGSALK